MVLNALSVPAGTTLHLVSSCAKDGALHVSLKVMSKFGGCTIPVGAVVVAAVARRAGRTGGAGSAREAMRGADAAR